MIIINVKKDANYKQRNLNNSNKKTMLKNIIINKNCLHEDNEGCNAICFRDQCKILKMIKDQRYLNFFYFCCCTGLRVCEAFSIKVNDIDKKNGLLKVKMCDSKTKKHKRSIPFLPELLKSMPLNQKYLFSDISEAGSKQYFYNLYKELGLDLSRHSTRHTFVSVCSYIKIAPEQIQEWAGHTNLKMTTETYTHKLDKGSSPILIYLKKLKKQLKLKTYKEN